MIALLESRMQREMARLVEKHGGSPRCVPALREAPACRGEVLLDTIDELISSRHEIVIFMTGAGAAFLFEAAEREGLRHELVIGLQRVTTVARGPKPAAALRGFGVKPAVAVPEPFTSAELLDTLNRMPLAERRVLLFHCGERSATLAETLRARGVQLAERRLYRWLLPADTAELERLIESIVAREIDALAITCQLQFRHLIEVARHRAREQALIEALRRDIVLAAVGPTSSAILRSYAVPVHVMPDQHRMERLVQRLMLHLEQPSQQLAYSPSPVLRARIES